MASTTFGSSSRTTPRTGTATLTHPCSTTPFFLPIFSTGDRINGSSRFTVRLESLQFARGKTLTKRHALTSNLPPLSQPLPSILPPQPQRAHQSGHPDQPEVSTPERSRPGLCESPLTPVALAAIEGTRHLLPRTCHAQHNMLQPLTQVFPLVMSLPPDAQTSSRQRSSLPSDHSPIHSSPPLQLRVPPPDSSNCGLTPQ